MKQNWDSLVQSFKLNFRDGRTDRQARNFAFALNYRTVTSLRSIDSLYLIHLYCTFQLTHGLTTIWLGLRLRNPFLVYLSYICGKWQKFQEKDPKMHPSTTRELLGSTLSRVTNKPNFTRVIDELLKKVLECHFTRLFYSINPALLDTD